MAYVKVTKDLTRVKTKLALGLTKRQLICFGIAAAMGGTVYMLLRNVMGSEGAVYVMAAAALPMFIFGVYEKDGQPLEKILFNFVKAKIIYPRYRPYVTENLYDFIRSKLN